MILWQKERANQAFHFLTDITKHTVMLEKKIQHEDTSVPLES